MSEKLTMLNVVWSKSDGGAGKYGEYAAARAACPFHQ